MKSTCILIPTAVAALIHLFSGIGSAKAACATYAAGVARGTVSIAGLTEASGIAASRRNAGVLWTHNDGFGGIVHAIGMNGAHLASFYLNRAVADTEDIAVGPGPEAGLSYLYVGDIGAKNSGRREVQILRIPEPAVDLGWAGAPRSVGLVGVEVFTLLYPDGKYDAESLMVDPVSGEVVIVTKQDGGARVYRANLNQFFPGARVPLSFVQMVAFPKVSGGDISADGTQIVLRREDFALQWERFAGESLGGALSRQGLAIPVIGPPREPNGEGIALMPDGSGYVTISEGVNPQLYFFESVCPSHPRFTLGLKNQVAHDGGTVIFAVRTTAYPAPTYLWRHDGIVLPGETRRYLVLRHVSFADEGQYMVTAINPSGRVASRARLVVLP